MKKTKKMKQTPKNQPPFKIVKKIINGEIVEIKKPKKIDKLVIKVPSPVETAKKKKSKKKRRAGQDVDSVSESPGRLKNGAGRPNRRSPLSTTSHPRPSTSRSAPTPSPSVRSTPLSGRSTPHSARVQSGSSSGQDGFLNLGTGCSVERGMAFLGNLIAPYTVDEFMTKYWEQRPLVVTRNQADYFNRLELTTGTLDTMMRQNNLRYTKNVDVVSYVDGIRQTHNPDGRAIPLEVWDFYRTQRYSVRWLNPQIYSNRLWTLCAGLQEYFGCFVGANIYMTPANSQGFAPHFDDIEAFIVQLEGRKHWRLYRPRPEDVLTRHSSHNFTQKEIGKPFFQATLNAGDVMYFPRGTIHQAVATDSHSLHVTLSCYQHNSWADLLEQLLPAALSKAVAVDQKLRAGLPIGHLNYMGEAHRGESTYAKDKFLKTVTKMVKRVTSCMDVDAAVDKHALRFMEDALPPALSGVEKVCWVMEDGDRMLPGSQLVNEYEMNDSTMVRLTRAHCLRLVLEAGCHRVYYSTENTREYHEVEPGFLELGPEMVPCMKQLIQAYPDYIPVGEMELPTLLERASFCAHLWAKGVLLTQSQVATN